MQNDNNRRDRGGGGSPARSTKGTRTSHSISYTFNLLKIASELK